VPVAGPVLYIVEAGSLATVALASGDVIGITSVATGGFPLWNGQQISNGSGSIAVGVNADPTDPNMWAQDGGSGNWFICPPPITAGAFFLANPQPSQEIIMSGSNLAPVQTGTVQISGGQGSAGVFDVAFGYYPREGSRLVAAQYNWTANTFFNEDLSQLVARGVETTIQSVFVDNSSLPEPVVITIGGSNQVIECPANSQGIFPCFFTGTPSFQISVNSVSPNVTRLYLLNVPANTAGSWPAPIGGSLAAISPAGSPAAMNSLLGITGTTQVKVGVGRVAKVTVVAAIATGAVTIDDAAATGTPNTILDIPVGAAAGTVYQLDWPVKLGIAANFAGTGTIAISFT
jgi:hypothetical protein